MLQFAAFLIAVVVATTIIATSWAAAPLMLVLPPITAIGLGLFFVCLSAYEEGSNDRNFEDRHWGDR
jgi:hypothetical protein